jgi:hypothetical protein
MECACVSTLTEPRQWTVFTFLPGSLDVPRLCDLVRTCELGFDPTVVRIRSWGADQLEAPYDDAVWARIVGTPDVHGFALESDGAEPSLSADVFPVEAEVMIAGVAPTSSFLTAVLELPGLVGGASGDATDARWQGETEINHYRMWYDGPWEHLPRTTDEWGDEIIDVSGNPGRITEIPGMRLWPAQDLWFGPGSALVISYDAVATLPVGRVTALGEGRYHVRLWEDGTPLDDVRKAQQALRDHLGYDAAEAREDEIRDALTAGQPDDPMFVVQRGAFPHGGAERFLQYFSASKHPTTRSRAAWLVVLEYDDEGHLVHRDDVDLSSRPHPDLT